MRRTLGAFAGLTVLLLSGCAGMASSQVTVTAPGPTVTVTVPAPTVTVTVEAVPESPTAALTDGQRATLDVTFGRSLGASSPLETTYCPMDEGGRRYYADLIARQIDTITPDLVMQYLSEVC